jgi:spermidine dehydrogenase
MSHGTDRELGMNRAITRRDFLNGISVALSGAAVYPWFDGLAPAFQPAAPGADYPPALTGMRGSHAGSFEVAHGLRAGNAWEADAAAARETYDLIVVGGGISGLAAAYFYRQMAPGASVLILDNHDDFGGHAKRNEFTHGGRTLIGYGGTQSIDTPSRFSQESMNLLKELGIDLDKFYTAFDQNLYGSLGLGPGVFFNKEAWGADRLVRGGSPQEGLDTRWWRSFAAQAPFEPAAREDFIRLYEAEVDYLPGLSAEEKRAKLRRMSYRDFLRDLVKVHPQVIAYFQQRPHTLYGVGIEAVAATSQIAGGAGFRGMGLAARAAAASAPARPREPYIFHFPDGNASIARLLVRRMIPNVASGDTMEDVVTSRFKYGSLDEPGAPVRIRLNSTAVRVKHLGDPAAAREVEVTYVKGGKAHRVKGRGCVLACYHSVIPHLAPELPGPQRDALSFGVKVPLVYTNVLIRNWTSFQKLAVTNIYGPSSYFAQVTLDFPVSLGTYRCPRTPEEPMLLHVVRTPCKPGVANRREQHRAGRAELLQTSFETFERQLRDQLGRSLSAGGFDPARDIEAITVNRWPHGYADEGDALNDPDYASDAERPWVIARQRFGRITIANSDAARRAYTDAAIDQGHRAARELT